MKEENGLSMADIQTNSDNIYNVSREIFLVFARSEKVLLKMTLKKASLKDIFIELTEGNQNEATETSFKYEFEETVKTLDSKQETGIDNDTDESEVSNFDYACDGRRVKTDQLLYALPITTTHVVIEKYLSLLIVYLVPLCIICIYPLIFAQFRDVYLLTSYGSVFAFFMM